MSGGLTLPVKPLWGTPDARRAPGGGPRHTADTATAAGPAWPFDATDADVLRFERGDVVINVGDRFDGVYALRAGSCKVVVISAGGDEHITAFRIAGELVGCEGIASGMHEASVRALEPVVAWRIPSSDLDALLASRPGFARWFTQTLAAQATASLHSMLRLGSLSAEQRVASLLLDLATRYGRPAPPRASFVLHMTRAEIGLHLGLSTETVSRTISRFSALDWIALDRRRVHLCAPDCLRDLIARSR